MNEQRWTSRFDDDTEGHAMRGKAEAEAAEVEDTEGHRIKFKADAQAAEADDDTEGHRSYWSDRNVKDQVEPVAWEDQDEDTEGHGISRKFGDSESAEADDTQGHAKASRFADAEAAEDDDTEGHRSYWSDRNVKDQVEPVTWGDEDDDTEGHGIRGRA